MQMALKIRHFLWLDIFAEIRWIDARICWRRTPVGRWHDSLEKVVDLPGLWDEVLELGLNLPKPLSGPAFRLAVSKADPRESQSDSDGSCNPESMRKQMTSNDIIQRVSAKMTVLLNQE
jgi:hypothetical protein